MFLMGACCLRYTVRSWTVLRELFFCWNGNIRGKPGENNLRKDKTAMGRKFKCCLQNRWRSGTYVTLSVHGVAIYDLFLRTNLIEISVRFAHYPAHEGSGSTPHCYSCRLDDKRLRQHCHQSQRQPQQFSLELRKDNGHCLRMRIFNEREFKQII